MSSTARKNISIWTAVLFLITGATGIILLFVHPGRGADHANTGFIIKHIHEIAALPFTLIAAVHVCFNWKTLVKHFRG